MSGSDFIPPVHLVTNGSMAGDITGPATNFSVQGFSRMSFQFIWTGTPTGSFFVDVSQNATDWAPLPLSPAPVAAGIAGNAFVDAQTGAVYMRVRYVRTSGTGTLNVIADAKVV